MLENVTTPRPWVRREGDPSKENLVAVVRGITIYGPYSAASCGADADLIVRAVNAHDDLVAACELALHKIEQTLAGQYADGAALRATLDPLRAALAKAGKS